MNHKSPVGELNTVYICLKAPKGTKIVSPLQMRIDLVRTKVKCLNADITQK